MNKTALITGYTGQDGTFLTRHLLDQGYRVLGMVRRISTEPPRRVRGKFDFKDAIDAGGLILVEGDLESPSSLHHIISFYRPDEIYNLAAQSHVGVSFKQVESTINANFMGVVNLISAIEAVPDYSPRIYQASTSEMFGDRDSDSSMDESTALRPNSPYAIAKTAAHQYCQMKRKQGMFISCGILFNHESEIRGGDFVTQKIARSIAAFPDDPSFVKGDDILKLGNLDAMRDWGYAGDYVKAMALMLQQDEPGDYVVGTGYSHSVREFVEAAWRARLGAETVIDWKADAYADDKGSYEAGYINGRMVVAVDPQFYRPNDVGFLKAEPAKIEALGWEPEFDFESLVYLMVQAAREERI